MDTRKAERLVLTQASPEGDVLPNEWRNFTRHHEEGVTHVLSGFDHLLFLLVVLATGGGLRNRQKLVGDGADFRFRRPNSVFK